MSEPQLYDGRRRRLVRRKAMLARYDFSPRFFDKLIHDRKIPFIKIGRVLLFDPLKCDEALARFEIKSRNPNV